MDPPEKELERIRAVLPEIVRNVKVPVSVDTYRPQVAEYALKVGSSIVNDVTGGKLYPEMCRIVADHGASVILMAREKEPQRGLRPIDRVINALEETIDHIEKCCVEPNKYSDRPRHRLPASAPTGRAVCSTGRV